MPLDNPFEKEPVGVIDLGRLVFTFLVLIALLGSDCSVGFPRCLFLLAVTTGDKETWIRIKDAFQVILPVVTGILGTVVAFYFGKPKG